MRNTNKFDCAEFQHMSNFGLLRSFKPTPGNFGVYFSRAPLLMKASLDIIRYIILVYDKESPYLHNYSILSNRKKAAAHFVGLDKDLTERAINLSDDVIVDALSDFLKFQDDSLWSLIVQSEEVFNSNQRQILAGVGSENKDTDRFRASELSTKLLKLNNEIRRDLKVLYAEFTGTDLLAEAAFKKRRAFTPEVVAEFNYHIGNRNDEEQ